MRWPRIFVLRRRGRTGGRFGCAGFDLTTGFLRLCSRSFFGDANLFGFFGGFLCGGLFFEAALLGFKRTLLFLSLP
jgi:hypothetical protein